MSKSKDVTTNVAAKTEVSRVNPNTGRVIGSILVEQGSLKVSDVERVQRFARNAGIRFGDAAITLRLVTTADIDSAIAQQYRYPILARGGDGGVSDELLAAYSPQSPLVEPLRLLRSQLSLRWETGKSTKILVIASPDRGDGRTWLAANLATVFAQMGERTLLIDADMRHPGQHRLFNLDNSVGLSALLTGRAGREAVSRIHPQMRLFVLPAGIVPPNPQELLGRPVFELVIAMFGAQHDVVILDTPAMSESADAQLLATRCDAALMLVRRNHTRRELLDLAMQNLGQTGVKIMGGVINEY